MPSASAFCCAVVAVQLLPPSEERSKDTTLLPVSWPLTVSRKVLSFSPVRSWVATTPGCGATLSMVSRSGAELGSCSGRIRPMSLRSTSTSMAVSPCSSSVVVKLYTPGAVSVAAPITNPFTHTSTVLAGVAVICSVGVVSLVIPSPATPESLLKAVITGRVTPTSV